MKTAEEILAKTLNCKVSDIYSHGWIHSALRAMEEYRSQDSELPSDDRMVVEILNKIVIHSKQCRPTESGHGIVVALVNECLILLSEHSPSPILASKDARIKELEEEVEELKSYIRTIQELTPKP